MHLSYLGLHCERKVLQVPEDPQIDPVLKGGSTFSVLAPGKCGRVASPGRPAHWVCWTYHECTSVVLDTSMPVTCKAYSIVHGISRPQKVVWAPLADWRTLFQQGCSPRLGRPLVSEDALHAFVLLSQQM